MTDTATAPAGTAPALVAPTVKGAALVGGGKALGIIPQDFESAWRMAQIAVKAGIVPKELKEVEAACVAILHGLEVGLPPMAALQSVAVINGRPCLWGDAMLGLVRASGLLESIVEELERDADGTPAIAYCTVKRRGEQAVTRSFSRAEAQKAGLWTKDGPWKNYPSRMMPMRARSWALRDVFPDVFKGLANREEVEDFVDVTSRGAASFAEPKRSDFAALSPAANGQAGASSTPAAGGDRKSDTTAPDKSEAAGQPATTKVWSIPDDIVGQGPRTKAILELLECCHEEADVDALEAEHKAFLDKLGRTKAETMKAFTDRKLELAAEAAQGTGGK